MRKLAPVTPATIMPKQAVGDRSAALIGLRRGESGVGGALFWVSASGSTHRQQNTATML